MLFRGTHDSSDVGAVGLRTGSEHSGDEDETCSTSGRSYTSAESATAQSFEMRMAQLDGNGGLGSGALSTDNNSGSSDHKLLSPSYHLFSTSNNPYGGLSDDKERNGGQYGLTLVSGGDNAGTDGDAALSGTRASDYPDEDARDDDYLTALLSDIERHAARLDTQFFRYPSAESLKQQQQQLAAHAKDSPTGGPAKAGDTAAGAEATATKTATTDDGGARYVDAAAASASASGSTVATPATGTPSTNGPSGSSHSTGTKLFLGGLRYEVIQSGRHTVSWIFQVACGVHINPSSILIHRKTKNGRSNVAPTGCASVFVADDNDVAALLEMNQRIYCAEEGVYVSPSPDVMKELIASKDIVDVTGGRVRGPTHPVVIERAYSVNHHHGHHSSGSGSATTSSTAAGSAVASARRHATNNSSGNSATTVGVGAAANAGGGSSSGNNNVHSHGNTSSGAAGGGANRHGRTQSVTNVESNLSNQLMGVMPPPYDGAMPPQYSSTSNVSSSTVGAYGPPSYAPSSVPSGSLGAPSIGVQRMGATPSGFPPGAVIMSGQTTPSMPLALDDGRSTNTAGPSQLDLQRVTFHPYLRGGKAGELSGDRAESPAAGTTTTHTVLFLAALPSDSTEDYVSWLFSLMSITLPSTRIHIIGGGPSSVSVSSSSCAAAGGGAAGSASTPTDCCATVSISESDVTIALNFHHRVLCTSRGVWIGHSAQDIMALRASDASLRDAAALHVDRRMFSQPLTSSGPSSSSAAPTNGVGLPSAYPHALPVGGGAGASMPPPPASYPQVFGGMPLPGGLPIAGPWGFAPAPGARPGVTGEAMYANLPPPPSAGAAGLPPGAVPLQTMMSAGSGYSMPPPPFAFTPSVTIGDRTYQLPPGATVQYVPVITANQGVGVPNEASMNKSASSHASTAGKESGEGQAASHGSASPHAGPRN